ncbi:MAG: Gfo/Idh/MocA family oxidoreductase [Thermotogaceae bacterium]|nr:Gfo/Idh/MocA family oxidoreductase [Thermotogaceae bacterium]
MDKLRIGIIGTGKIAEVLHVPNIVSSEYAEVVALSNPHEEKMKRLAKKYNLNVPMFTDYRELLKLREVDAVVIATPNALHAPVTVDALKAGKHVLVEKPMATTSEDALKMIETAKEVSRVLMVNHSQRFFPHHQKAKEIIDSGILGEIRLVKTMFGHPGPENWSPSAAWFFDKERAMFGALGDLGVHKVDLIRYLTGLEITECYAFTNTLEKNGTVEDIASAVMKLSNGALATLNVNWVTKGLEENYIAIYGKNGTMKVGYSDPNRIDLYLSKPVNFHGFIELQPLFTNEDPYWKTPIIDHFAKVCLGLEKPAVDPYDGYIAVKVVEKMVESSEKGRAMRVE